MSILNRGRAGGAHATRRLVTTLATIVLAALVAGCEMLRPESYSLPIKVGQSVGDVDLALGNPTETVGVSADGVTAYPARDSNHDRIYYEHGLFCSFEAGKLVEITVHDTCDYRGFKPFKGKVARGISLADSRASVLKRMGRPDDTACDPIEAGIDRDFPASFASSTIYTWHSRGYDLKVCFLDQARRWSDTLVFPRNHISWIAIAAPKPSDK